MCPTQTRYSNSNSEWDSGCAYYAPQCTLATRRFASGSFRFHSLSLFLKPHPYKPSPSLIRSVLLYLSALCSLSSRAPFVLHRIRVFSLWKSRNFDPNPPIFGLISGNLYYSASDLKFSIDLNSISAFFSLKNIQIASDGWIRTSFQKIRVLFLLLLLFLIFWDFRSKLHKVDFFFIIKPKAWFD